MYELHVRAETPHEVIKNALREGGIYRAKAILKRLEDSELQDLKEAMEELWPAASERLERQNVARTKAIHWLNVVREEFGVSRRGAIELLEQMAEMNKPKKRRGRKAKADSL